MFVFETNKDYICGMDLEYLKEFAKGAILLDGLEEAIIGIVEEFGNGPRILYSKKKIIEILMERDSMTELDAIEFYDYNILGLYASPQNALFLEDTI